VPNMAVFFSSMISRFPGVLFLYFINYFDTVPVTPAITFAFYTPQTVLFVVINHFIL
jgi:hypothetical protein